MEETKNLGLKKPSIGAMDWGEAFNQNLDKIDREAVRHSMRQVVATGRVDAFNRANFLESHWNSAVDLFASPDMPVEISFAAGFDHGAKDYAIQFEESIQNAWIGLPLSARSYLFVERDPLSGAPSFGYSSRPPKYGFKRPQFFKEPAVFIDPSGFLQNGDNSPWPRSVARTVAVSMEAPSIARAILEVRGHWTDAAVSDNAFSGGVRVYASVNGGPEIDITTAWSTIAEFQTGATEFDIPNPESIVLNGNNTVTYRFTHSGGYREHLNVASTSLKLYEEDLTDAHWFDLNLYRMKVWNGSEWEFKQRVFVGEASTDESGQVSLITYALKGLYDSGWFFVSSNTNYVKDHHLGIDIPSGLIVDFYFSMDEAGLDASYAHDLYVNGSSAIGHYHRQNILQDTRNQIWFGFGAFVQVFRGANRGTGYYRVFVRRGW